MPTHKSNRLKSHHRSLQSLATHRYDDKGSIPHEEKINNNLKALQWESDDNNSGEDLIDDGEDDLKELAQELNKEEGLGESV